MVRRVFLGSMENAHLADPETVSFDVIIRPHLILSCPLDIVSRLAPLKKSMNNSFNEEMLGGSSRKTPSVH